MANFPAPPPVELDAWRRVLAAALGFRTLAPWRWMSDTATSVHLDARNSPWFACVLGQAGQVFGLVLYRGEAGFRAMRALHVAETAADLEEVSFQQCAIDVTFGPKQLLDAHDLKRLKALDYAASSKTRLGWPSFRSHRPGHAPWHLDAEEVGVLTAALLQVTAFASALRDQPDCYAHREPYEYPILSNAVSAPGDLEWRHWLPPQPPALQGVSIADPGEVYRLRKLPLDRSLVLELDVIPVRTPITDRERPYYPQQVTVVDSRNGMVLSLRAIDPEDDGPRHLAAALVEVMAKAGRRPAEIQVQRQLLALVLGPLAEQLDIRSVALLDELPLTTEFRASLDDFLARE